MKLFRKLIRTEGKGNWQAKANQLGTGRTAKGTRPRHATLAAVAPHNPSFSRPSFSRVPPGMHSVHPFKCYLEI